MKYNNVFATEVDFEKVRSTISKPQLTYIEATEKVYCLSEDNKA